MANRLTSLFLLLALTAGVAVGTPLHSTSGKMMSCCEKARSGEKTSQAMASGLCCSVNCSESAPTSSGFSANFAPSSVNVSKSIAEQIAELFPAKSTPPMAPQTFSRVVPLQTHQPIYIRHKALLI